MFPREYFDTYWRPDLRDEVFVAMSFAACFNDAWTEIIRPAVDGQLADLNLTAHRVDTTTISGSILTEIMDGIANARFVLADISTEPSGYRNANVLYEVGLAHALRQPEEVLLLRQDNEQIAFDVASVRVHVYNPNDANGSRDQIARLIRTCLREIDLRKGLKVQQAVESLDGDCLTLLTNHGSSGGFSVSDQRTMRDAMNALPTRSAVSRMLDLGVIRTDANRQAGQCAYHWTLLGQAVLGRLGFRACAPTAARGTEQRDG